MNVKKRWANGPLRLLNRLQLKRNNLLFLAGAVWLAAGFNILRIGAPGMVAGWVSPAVPLLCAAVVFGLFFGLIFYKMVKKHCRRIRAYEQARIPFYRFFDRKSYLIMAFMITFGVTLRASNLIPPLYLGTFYTGLGASLMGAGIFFLIRWARRYAAAPTASNTPENSTPNDSLPQDMVGVQEENAGAVEYLVESVETSQTNVP